MVPEAGPNIRTRSMRGAGESPHGTEVKICTNTSCICCSALFKKIQFAESVKNLVKSTTQVDATRGCSESSSQHVSLC